MRTLSIAASAALLAGCAAPAAAPGVSDARETSLVGTHWIGIVDASVDRNAVPRIDFVSEGRLSGYTGCNMLSGAWSREGAAMRLHGIATTKRMCVGAGDEVEKRVLAAVNGESRAGREGDNLVFTGPSGARFEFKPAR